MSTKLQNPAKALVLKSHSSLCEILPARGGLVSKLVVNGRSLLWLPEDFSSEESSWPGGGIPLCFPFAGRVWQNGTLYQYGLGQKTFPMPLHGFAFASSFEVLDSTADSATLILKDSEASRILYPFSFELKISFKLSDQKLNLQFQVTHLKPVSGSEIKEMPVALGFHPYFKLNHLHPEMASLSVPAKLYHPVTPAGAAGKSEPSTELGSQPWPIQHPLLKSLILTDLEENASVLATSPDQPKIFVKAEPADLFRHVVVWSNQIEQFYCVEPWMSLPDAVATPSGCRWLKVGESLKGQISVQSP